MGRPRKQRLLADVDSIKYIENVISVYPTLKNYCESTEESRPSLLINSGIKAEVYLPTNPPHIDMLIEPNAKGDDLYVLEKYLEAKEQIYLLEHGVRMLDGIEKQVATQLFLERDHWSEVTGCLFLSKATVFRIRRRALLKLAQGVDVFMRWKVRMQFGKGI